MTDEQTTTPEVATTEDATPAATEATETPAAE